MNSHNVLKGQLDFALYDTIHLTLRSEQIRCGKFNLLEVKKSALTLLIANDCEKMFALSVNYR